MPKTLYRKYRPQNFSEIIGQNHIVQTLSNSVKNDRVSHAYLFTGPRGTGKTSIARILAKTINCKNKKTTKNSLMLPCEKCSSCKTINSGKSLDIFEIDAASNTGVDNIRELRETVNVAPSNLKLKVYIIDEVHMLSTGAFNALLKTLEEPPSFAIFILATTEIHKIPETIISRCQRFDFSRLTLPQIIERLSEIARVEKVKIEKEALELIALSAEGGMRDAESLLGQIISLEDKNITPAEVREITGSADRKSTLELTRSVLEKNSSKAISLINDLSEGGYDLEVFTKSVINQLRQILLLKINDQLEKYFSLELTPEQIKEMKKLTEKSQASEIISIIDFFVEAQRKISSSVLPQLPLEIAIIKSTGKIPAPSENLMEKTPNIQEEFVPATKKSQEEKERTKPADSKTTRPSLTNQSKTENNPNENPLPSQEKSPEKDNLAKESASKTSVNIDDVRSHWKKLLVDIHPYNHSLSALLSNCKPEKVEDDRITLATPYSFYQEKLSEANNRLTIEDVLGKILGAKITLVVRVDKDLSISKKTSPENPADSESKQDPLLDSALEIMGGKVVEK